MDGLLCDGVLAADMLSSLAMAEKVPRLVNGIDIRAFKLDPMDGFLLTRIDGRLGVRELARETGLPDFSVERSLEKLEKLGVIERFDPSAVPPPKPPQTAEAKPTAVMSVGGGLLAPKYDESELDAPADLTREQKKRILDYFHRLEDLDYFTLLGVTRDANRKAIKRAYYELAGTFHPDRYFKKDLGVFKSKMEVLFTRVTDAHDTLVDSRKRAEYEAYLDEVATTHGMEAMLERAMAESQRVEAPSTAPAAFRIAEGRTTPGASSGPPPGAAASSPAEQRARREALARRLMGGARRPVSAPPKATASEAPDPRAYASASDAVDALRRRYEQKIEYATTSQVQQYVSSAEEALAKGDLVAAASSLSIATRLSPDDEDLARRYAEVKTEADTRMCETYLKQAETEESAQRWPEAARSWRRVANIRVDDPKAHQRAARAMVRMGGGDLHQAADHAKKAVALAPESFENQLTLLEVYIKAGLTASARRVAEAAEKVSPNDTRLHELVKKIGKT